MPIKINQLKSAQRDHFQLNVAEIEFNPGDIVALIGANGSGKTTLIEAMLGLINTETRDMTMFGQPVSAFDSDLALKKRIGVQLQKSSFSQRLKVAEIVKMHHLFYDRINPQSFEQLSIEGLAALKYDTLSRGQRQRVDLLIALAHDPDLVFLDEPATGLDVEHRTAFSLILNHLKQRGATALMATHTAEEIAFCNKVIWMDQGRIKHFGECQNVIDGTLGRFRTDLSCTDSAAAEQLGRLLSDTPDIFHCHEEKERLRFSFFSQENHLLSLLNTIGQQRIAEVQCRSSNYSDLIEIGSGERFSGEHHVN